MLLGWYREMCIRDRSQGMTNFMKELKPDCLEDIIAGVSLYRPGPMDQIPRYIANKKDPEHAVYTHEALKPILNVTYGCMVYQEQVMQIVRDLAGYSLGRADLVRRAMGKKKLDVMAKEREIFINGQEDEQGNVVVPGCVRNGIDEPSANTIFDEMAEFAKYAFNKSHACLLYTSTKVAKQNVNLIQEISRLKKRVDDIEEEKNNNKSE